MSNTVGNWVNIPSHGCFVYSQRELAETPELVRALITSVTEGLGIAQADLKISTKNYQLQWSKFAWSKVDAALENGALSIALLVGTPSEVHLGAKIALRLDPKLDRQGNAPPLVWVAAQSVRWPREQFVGVGRSWLRACAEHGNPLSGGVLAASELRNAKIEASLEYESVFGETPDEFQVQIRKEPHSSRAWEQIRRIYPITLLGPQFASRTSDEKLRAAGAVAVESIGSSLIVDATSEIAEAWSPGYLDATRKLRELAWPWTFQHPLDDPKARRRR